MSATQPTQVEALDALQRDTMQRIRTAVPGIVVAYDPVTNAAQIQPAIGGRDVGTGLPISLPILPDVPVMWPRGAGVTIRGELITGDSVLLLVCDRALEDWIALGGVVPGRMTRMHSLADAVALPMLSPLTSPLPPSGGRLVIGRDDGTATITITLPTGGPPVVTIDAPLINLGAAAALGNARVTDPVAAATTMAAWIASAQTVLAGAAALLTLPVPTVPTDFGVIQSGSTKVLSE